MPPSAKQNGDLGNRIRELRSHARGHGGRIGSKKRGKLAKWVRNAVMIMLVGILLAVTLIWLVLMKLTEGERSCNGAGALLAAGVYQPLAPGQPGPNKSIVAIALAVAGQMHASPLATLALMEAGLVESGFKNYANDGKRNGNADNLSTNAQLAEAAKSMAYPHDAVGSDHASAGFVQQQVGPDFKWGSVADIMNPAYAAKRFLEEAATLEGRMAMSNRTYSSAGSLAQDVQVSAFPERYDAKKSEAEALMASVTTLPDGSVMISGTCQGAFVPGEKVTHSNYGYQIDYGTKTYRLDENGQRIPSTGKDAPAEYTFVLPADGPLFAMIQAALRMVDEHRPYIWAGGNESGPGHGYQYCSQTGGMIGEPMHTTWCTGFKGFDCSGLTDFTISSSGAVSNYPNNCADCQLDWMRSHGAQSVQVSELVAGDIIFWDYTGDGNEDHTAVALGPSVLPDGTPGPQLMIAAPSRGDFVKIQRVYERGNMNYMRYFTGTNGVGA